MDVQASAKRRRAYYDADAATLINDTPNEILGALCAKLSFAVEPTQRTAWAFQIEHLKGVAAALPSAHFFLEFLIPRMGRRVDAVIVYRGVIYLIEYKVGSASFERHAIEQVYGYGLDLKHFHETSHERLIVPIVVATRAIAPPQVAVNWDYDGLAQPLLSSPAGLCDLIVRVAGTEPALSREFALDPLHWSAGRYKPTPTIIEAAQALYRGHDVHEISRSEAGAENLSATADYISGVIDRAKRDGRKVICFVTGVPGSGKTLAGLNIANERMKADEEEHAVFLSGNGPLVDVLRKALADDAMDKPTSDGSRRRRAEEERKAAAFIQNIHHFRDEALASNQAPVGKVVVFDEAQRAWDVEQTSRFMREKRGQHDFSMSEPNFLLSVMDRHPDWCAVICLVGGGQEINTGEAGLDEWTRTLARSFPQWRVCASDRTDATASLGARAERSPALHLSTCIRSFRAEKLSDFVAAVIDGRTADAANIAQQLTDFPLAVTRSLESARGWLRAQRRGTERMGLLASSNALRLKPEGIFVKAKVDPPLWFLAPSDDVRSADSLEDAATEFEVQGLELDWAGVCWDGNFHRASGDWLVQRFRGTRWERVSDQRRRAYVANSYRVLLTRARQGMIIFVPMGDNVDKTRAPSLYDETYEYLVACGVPAVGRR